MPSRKKSEIAYSEQMAKTTVSHELPRTEEGEQKGLLDLLRYSVLEKGGKVLTERTKRRQQAMSPDVEDPRQPCGGFATEERTGLCPDGSL